MRIAHVTPYVSGIGGMEIYLFHLCRYLRERGAEVRIAAPEVGGGMERETVRDGFPVYHYPLPGDLSTAEVQGIAPARGGAALHRWIAGYRPDLVHFHSFGLGMGVEAIEAARAAGAKTVVTLHLPSLGLVCLRTTMMHWGTEPCDGKAEAVKCAACCYQAKGIPRMVAPLAVRVAGLARGREGWAPGGLARMAAIPGAVEARVARQREAFAACDAFVAVADWARQVLIANGLPPDQVALNRVGCSLATPPARRMRSGRPANGPVRIGFVGRFHAEKGVHHLIRAFRRLAAAAPVELELCGSVNDQTGQQELAALRALCGSDPRIHLRTNLVREDVADTMATWDVLCCPSTQFELGPMVVLEAFAMGTPVIGSDLPNINTLVSDGVNGRLFPMGDEQALARILFEIVASPETTVQAWQRSIPPVRTMDDVAADYLQLYRTLCLGKSATAGLTAGAVADV